MGYLIYIIGAIVGMIIFEAWNRYKNKGIIERDPDEKHYIIPKNDVEVIYYSPSGSAIDTLKAGTKCVKNQDGTVTLILENSGPVKIRPTEDLKYDNILNLVSGNTKLIVDPEGITDTQSDKWKKLYIRLKKFDYEEAKYVIEEIEARRIMTENKRKREMEEINYKKKINQLLEEGTILEKRKTTREKLPEIKAAEGDKPLKGGDSGGHKQ